MYWKNKPIDNLTESELREALANAIDRLLCNPTDDKNQSIVFAYLAGFASSAVIMGIIVSL